jgi:hypothetical protein
MVVAGSQQSQGINVSMQSSHAKARLKGLVDIYKVAGGKTLAVGHNDQINVANGENWESSETFINSF